MTTHAPIPFLRARLSILMFLQFATWGAWAPVLGNHLGGLGFSGTQIGLVYLTGALGCILSPVVGGQIADRWFPTQIFLGISFFISAGFLYLVAQATDFNTIFWLALGSMVFFGPTLALSNSLSFHHMTDARKDYPVVRLWGTLGWIAAGFIVSLYLGAEWLRRWFGIQPIFTWPANAVPFGHALYFGAVFSALCGLYCFTLPNTPPKRDAGGFAMGRVVGMLKEPSFAVFCALAFGILFFAAGYYNFQGLFFGAKNGANVAPSDVPMVALVGQIMEIVTMLLLPAALKKFGFKGTISLGIFAWALRFAIFGLATSPVWAVVGQSIHGFCFAFAIAASMIYVEKIAPSDLRGSAQSFIVIITYGFGMLTGSLVTGPLMGHFTVNGVTDWHSFWLTLSGGCVAVLILFLLGFKPRGAHIGAEDVSQEALLEQP